MARQINLHTSYLSGRLLRLYMNGAIFIKSSGKELGYLRDEDFNELIKLNLHNSSLDLFLLERVVVPITMTSTLEKFKAYLNSRLPKRNNCGRPRAIKASKTIYEKWKHVLSNLERTLYREVEINNHRLSSVAKRIGISPGYASILLSKAHRTLSGYKYRRRIIKAKSYVGENISDEI